MTVVYLKCRSRPDYVRTKQYPSCQSLGHLLHWQHFLHLVYQLTRSHLVNFLITLLRWSYLEYYVVMSHDNIVLYAAVGFLPCWNNKKKADDLCKKCSHSGLLCSSTQALPISRRIIHNLWSIEVNICEAIDVQHFFYGLVWAFCYLLELQSMLLD